MKSIKKLKTPPELLFNSDTVVPMISEVRLILVIMILELSF